MFGSIRRGCALLLVIAGLAAVLASCQNGRVGARCKTKDFGQDATNVLICRNGRWQRSITKQQAAVLIVNLLKSRQTTTTAPTKPVITQLTGGARHTCALRSDGTVWCWGYNASGELGDGTTTDALTPVRVAGLARATPVQVSGLTTATEVATAYRHSCALLADRTVRCWGYNNAGQLGDGTVGTRTTPVQTQTLTTATQLANSSCALLADNTVRCWGSNVYGQLGDATTTNAPTPVQVTGLATATQIANSGSHTCALLADHTVRCWGFNGNGEVGDATTTNRSAPVQVPGITAATQIATGSNHTCALLGDSTVRCWGSNTAGQLGDATTSANRLSPVQVALPF